jgi:hypothetical protein
MAIIDKKKKIFGDIAAAKTIVDGLPKLKLSSSFASITNGGDSISFLSDLLKSLVGYEKLNDIIVDLLTYSINELDLTLKQSIKNELKSIVNCGLNPSIPSYMLYGSTGVITPVKKIDYFNKMLTSPNSLVGSLIYKDISNGLSSSDFNTFLYYTIQNNGTPQNWGLTNNGFDLLSIQFNQISTPNNSLKITTSQNYVGSLTDLNNSYVDSLKLINTEGLLFNILDNIFGTMSNTINKSVIQIENELRLKNIVSNIIDNDDEDESKSIFDINTQNIESKANSIKNGTNTLNLNTNVTTSIPIDLLSDLNSSLNSVTQLNDKKNVLTSGINSIGNTLNNFTNKPNDDKAIKLNFIQDMINQITKSLTNVILSPPVVTIFLINYKIMYGQNAEYVDGVDFLKQNKTLISTIIDNIRDSISKKLLSIVLKEVTRLAAESAFNIETEKIKNRSGQILSLVGVPQDIIRQISGLI